MRIKYIKHAGHLGHQLYVCLDVDPRTISKKGKLLNIFFARNGSQIRTKSTMHPSVQTKPKIGLVHVLRADGRRDARRIKQIFDFHSPTIAYFYKFLFSIHFRAKPNRSSSCCGKLHKGLCGIGFPYLSFDIYASICVVFTNCLQDTLNTRSKTQRE